MTRLSAGLAAALALGQLPATATAQQPLSIEQLLVAERRWQLATAIDHRSAQPAPGIEERRQRLSTALRVGLHPRLELNARLSRDRGRLRRPGGTRRSGERALALGANWLLRREGAMPALLLEARARWRRDDAGEAPGRPGAQLIATAYRSFDPLVLSLTASADWPAGYRRGGRRHRPGAAWSVSPQVNFAVNHRVTLIGGLSLSRRQAPRVDGAALGRGTERLALRAGVGLTLGAGQTLFLTGEYSTAGAGGLSLQWLHDL